MTYRFELRRDWLADAPPILWVMLNPSTADNLANDPTIRKCIGFATRWGAGGISVVNLYGWRATDPVDLWKAADPIGKMNDSTIARYLDYAADLGARTIVAWGANARADRVKSFADLLGRHEAWHLGLTNNRQPRHPLMVPYRTPLSRWQP